MTSSQDPYRVAVVGAGPAGLYLVEALLRSELPLSVTVLDRSPSPFGLLRYGVAPDHPDIRGISRGLSRVFLDPRVGFCGNVELGSGVTVEVLRAAFDVVVYAYGSAAGSRVDVPGADLPGSVPASEVVSWYSGSPDLDPAPFDRLVSTTRRLVVVGAGNVALDVVRVLSRPAEDLRATEVPDHVLAALSSSPLEGVEVVVRRGPLEATWTAPELRGLSALPVDLVVDHADLPEPQPGADRIRQRNVEVLRSWSARPPGTGRRVGFRFWTRPLSILGSDRVEGIEVERTQMVDGALQGTGEVSTLQAEMVVHAVGYRPLPVPGVPLEEVPGTVPSVGGRVLRDGMVSPGEYVTGWLRRGPQGTVGTNRKDAGEVAAAVVEDLSTLPPSTRRGLPHLLEAAGLEVVSWEGWEAITAAEHEHGRSLGRDRVVLHTRAALLAASRSVTS